MVELIAAAVGVFLFFTLATAWGVRRAFSGGGSGGAARGRRKRSKGAADRDE